MVSTMATSCPKCGRPYPTRKRSSKEAQVGSAGCVIAIGVLIFLFGLYLFQLGPGDGVSQEAGAKFMVLMAPAFLVLGIVLLRYVLKKQDW